MEGMDWFSWIVVIGTLVVSVLIYFIWNSRKNNDYWTKRGIKDLPRTNIISLLTTLRKKALHELQLEQYRTHGRICGTFAFGDPLLHIGDPELLRDILIKDFHAFHFRQGLNFGYDLLDNMVSIMKGEDWKRVRTIITPIFTTKRLKMATNILNECSQSLMNEFQKAVENGTSVDMKKMFGAFTLDVIAQSAFATKINTIGNPENLFAQNAKAFLGNFSVTTFLILRFLPSWFPFRNNFGIFKGGDFFRDVIFKVINERKQKKKRHNDMLQLFMDIVEESSNEKEKSATQNLEPEEDQEDHYGSIIDKDASQTIKHKKLSEDEMVAQCVAFFTVGYETTALTLSYIAYTLALNSDCQEKLIREVDSAFESHKEMNYEAVRDMKYLDCVVSETLRVYPPATALGRTTAEDYELKGLGVKLEKGVVINVPIYAMHFDPEFFPEPEIFKPERFLEKTYPQYAYLPFGAGPRNCLGMRFALMQVKMCISNILRHYRFRLADNTKVPMEFKKGAVFLTVNELPLKVEKRNDVS